MDNKVNCLIPVWSGDRRIMSNNYILDKSVYLDKQIRQMREIKHNLAQITFINSFNPEESSKFRRVLDSIPDRIQNTKVEVIERQNIGMSYGAYSDAYSHYRDEFDYYILLEDDYIAVKDYFDNALVEICNIENADYLCQYANPWRVRLSDGSMYGNYEIHAAISNGIVRQDALEAVWQKFGKLPNAMQIGFDWHPMKKKYTNPGQVRFSLAFNAVGKTIKDTRNYFRSPFLDHFTEGREIREYFPENPEYIIVPIQMSGLWGDNG